MERQIRSGIPQVGVTPYTQIHAHSTGNPNSTAQNEADYMSRKDINTGFYTHVVGNGRVIQVANVNRGAWDVGGGWNYETYAAVELIESHKSKSEFERDYKLYVTLLRDLAKQAGLSNNLDTGTSGIITHAYATAHQPNNASDHVDPYPYLAKWGISKAQFAKDLKNGF
ncbi:N-acetylmuramoyl-L-alanine amidase, partial [Streptococcus thoraltensis]